MLVNGIGFLHVCPLCLEPPHHSQFYMLVDLSVLDLLYWVGGRPDVLCIFGDETWMEWIAWGTSQLNSMQVGEWILCMQLANTSRSSKGNIIHKVKFFYTSSLGCMFIRYLLHLELFTWSYVTYKVDDKNVQDYTNIQNEFIQVTYL